MARKSNFKPEYIEQAKKLCLLGATDKEMADFFNTSEKTLNNWKKTYPAFLQSIKSAKILADAEIANKLFNRANGYEHEDVKIMQYEGVPVIVKYQKVVEPDVTAQIFWLTNRQRDKWKRGNIEEEGGNGGDIIMNFHRGRNPDGS